MDSTHFGRRFWGSGHDELFLLREKMAAILKAKLIARKTVAEDRLRQLNQPFDVERGKSRQP
jgi:hypothetical protein